MALVAWWPLNGTLENKGIGDYANGEFSNASFESGCKLGKGALFAGSSQSIKINGGTALLKQLDNYSMACWARIKTNPSGHSGSFLSVGNWNGYSCNFGFYNNRTKILVPNTVGGGWSNGVELGQAIPLNEWHHFVVTWDGNNSKVYLDGIYKGSTTSGGIYKRTFTDEVSYFMLGRETYAGGTFALVGNLNDVRIYDECLSQKEIHEIYKTLILHYPMNQVDGYMIGRNLILNSDKVTGGENASGITTSYESDGTLKIVAASRNGNYRSCNFDDMNAVRQNVATNMSIGDAYTVSFDLKIEESNGKIPTLFLNSGNSYANMIGNANLLGQWQRVYRSGTWNNPGGSYGSISPHLGFASCIGTYYVKNFKLEKGSIMTPYTPAPEDGTICANDPIVYDQSGLGNDGTKQGNLIGTTAKKILGYGSYYWDGTAHIQGPEVINTMPKEDMTVSVWAYRENWSTFTGVNRLLSCTNGGGFNFEPGSLTNQEAVLGFAVYGSGVGYYHIYINQTRANMTSGWHLFTATKNASGLKIYVDGNLENSQYVETSQPASFTVGYTNVSLMIGAGAGSPIGAIEGTLSNTYLQDVRIYATALSANDIKELYQTRQQVDKSGNFYCTEIEEVEGKTNVSFGKNGVAYVPLASEQEEKTFKLDKSDYLVAYGLKEN